MKYLILIFLFLSSCTELEKAATEELKAQKEQQQSAPPVLAWGDKHNDWDKFLLDAVATSNISASAKNPCKTADIKTCLAQFISIMAKYESSFDPNSSYTESFLDVDGTHVVSRGLLQISKTSANQSAYGCGINKASELYDPKTNLECAVKIATHWINKDGVFYGTTAVNGKASHVGMSRYWAVCRESSGSLDKILKYVEKL